MSGGPRGGLALLLVLALAGAAPVVPADRDDAEARLMQLAGRGANAPVVEIVGRSNEGRPVPMARLGTGPTHVLVIAGQHGNEPVATEAGLGLLELLATQRGDPVLDRLTVLVLPSVNPDGARRGWRSNVKVRAQPQFGAIGRGYDINRYHLPALPRGADTPVPEAAAVQRVYRTWRPTLVIDLHSQGEAAGPGGVPMGSLGWPSHAGVDPAVVQRSKQVAVVMAAELKATGLAGVSAYNVDDHEGIARNAYGLLGSATLLVELPGSASAAAAGEALLRLLERTASGSVTRVDAARADHLGNA